MFEDWHRGLLHSCRVARLGTIAKDGRPHLVPVCYAIVDGGIVIPVDEKPKRHLGLARLGNIEREPRVSLLVDRYDDDWAHLAWIRIDGLATVHERGDEDPRGLDALRERYPQYLQMPLESLPFIRLAPTSVTGWRWAAGN